VHGGRHSAFTLFELLISMSILVFLVVLVARILSSTNVAVQAASKQMDVASQARTVLDRIGGDIASMVVAQGSAPIVVKDTAPGPPGSSSGQYNDGVAFITNARPRARAGTVTTPFIRMAMMGYRVSALKDSGLANTAVPMLNWGDGTISFSTAGNTVQNSLSKQVTSDFTVATNQAVTDVRTGDTSGNHMLQFQGVGPGIIRFEICFLLDDGTVVSTPPRDNTFPSVTNNAYAVALSKTVSADVSQRFVRAFIVGIAGLDNQTRQLVGSNGSNLDNLADALPNPALTNQTPLQAWDFLSGTTPAQNLRTALLPPNYPKPVINALRIYQRYFYVSDAQ
jgi:type II secretory pathway pseudopilin PulG